MDVLILDFAGAERGFRLRLGEFIDLEEACGTGMGVLYQRFATTSYFASDVMNVLLRGLVGGGMKAADAKPLVEKQMNSKPLMELAAVATDVILQAMSGIQPDDATPVGDLDQTIDKGALFHSFAQVGLSPDQVREMRYADFVALIRAAGGKDVQPPSEDEFADMLRDWEDRQE